MYIAATSNESVDEELEEKKARGGASPSPDDDSTRLVAHGGSSRAFGARSCRASWRAALRSRRGA